VEAGEEIQTHDAASDRRTADFHRLLMHPIDSRTLHVVPVRGADRVVGAIVLEDAAQFPDAREFVGLFANVLAVRMLDEPDRQARPDARVAETAPMIAGERSSDTDLVRPTPSAAAAINGEDVFSSAAVMSIKFGDAAVMTVRDEGESTTLADRLATILQDIAATHQIPYVKLVGHDAVAAVGLTAGDSTAAMRIADASVEARDRFLELLEAGGHSPSFRIGIDCGTAVSGKIGHHPRLFNLWGEAVRTAELMADTGIGPGTIQVSEAAYHRLRSHFLFRPRGIFYLPSVGPSQTFILGSRQ